MNSKKTSINKLVFIAVLALILTYFSNYIVKVDKLGEDDPQYRNHDVVYLELPNNYFLSSQFIRIATEECDGMCMEYKGFPFHNIELNEFGDWNIVGILENFGFYFLIVGIIQIVWEKSRPKLKK
jgi:hypothetical protein